MKETNFLKRNPNFLLVWMGQMLSQSGARMFQIAVVWSFVEKHSQKGGFFIGLFMVLSALPSILFVKKIGTTIDLYKRKHILVLSDFCASITVISTSIFIDNIFIVFLLGFCLALFQAFIDPTLNKSVQELVPNKDTETAISLFAITQSLANFAGATIGALLIDKIGISYTIVLSGIGYLFSAAFSFIAKFRYIIEQSNINSESLKEFLGKKKFTKLSTIGFGCVNFFLTPTLIILPLYVKEVLKKSAGVLGTLEASIWIGILLGSLIAKWIKFFTYKSIMAGILMLVVGVSLGLPSIIISSYFYLLVLFLSGTAIGINNVKFIAFFQNTIPPSIKGRFFAFLQAMIGFMFPVAYFVFGFLSQPFLPTTLCLIQGIGIIVVSVYFFLLLRYERAAL